jgi:hypothetical protein
MDASNKIITRGRSGSHSKQPHPTDQAAQATQSLQLLLQEDRLLQQYGLTETGKNPDQTAFPYAAALLQEEDDDDGDGGSDTKQRASLALSEVERKLALVESLAVKLSRTSPEAVAGHLLRLHGHSLQAPTEKDSSGSSRPTVTTLSAIRERSDRLQRQSDSLESVAKRVESSLQRGLTRMETACQRLERVLTLSRTLKQILRLQFETSKLRDYDLEDLRDLTRAAASVAVLEDLMKDSELQARNITVVETMRPSTEQTARAVRQAANKLLQEQHNQSSSLSQLGATLQVYYHLGELPDAVWKAVDQAHNQAESVCRQLWNPVTLLNLTEQAKKTAKDSRMIQKKLRQVRAEAAQEWAAGISEAALQVRNLQRVLIRKTDPVRRQVFIDVVAAASIPAVYRSQHQSQDFSLFDLFWARLCRTMGLVLEGVLSHDHGRLASDVAALYPTVRAGALQMIGRLQDTMPAIAFEDAGAAPTAGILGGSSVLSDSFLGQVSEEGSDENPQAGADSWTRDTASNTQQVSQRFMGSSSASTSSASLSTIFHSFEWKTLQGDGKSRSGLNPLERVFVQACNERLCSPLQYMFPDNVAMDDDGIAISSGMSLLPSKYDIQRFDENIRQELSLADPREGGGDLTAVTMIAECVVSMIVQFCMRAKNALSGVGEEGFLKEDWSMTESLQHDRKVAAIMFTLAKFLRNAPEKTFVAPYRPATTPQHEEAASMCQKALAPALLEIEKMVKAIILLPLCRTLNRRIAGVLAKVHLGVYKESGGGVEEDSPAFVQKHLTPAFEMIAENHLSKFPPEYAGVLAARVAAFSIYTFVSNASLVRPIGESARLHITQDLADLEMSLEQFVAKSGGNVSLSQIENGRPYAELRAVRQLLFWTGLDNKDKSAQEVAKSLLREVWMKDVRPSTVFHYLFSYAPSLLSSPHHAKRMKAEDYVATLVHFEGSVENGEDNSWMTTMTCCDSYQQRASSAGSAAADGDSRVAQILLALGSELMRRRRD